MATAQSSIAGDNKCVFCLDFLNTCPEVRKLPNCNHKTCTKCLKGRIASNKNVKCDDCGKVSEDLTVWKAPFVSTYTPPSCSATSCTKTPVVYCYTCDKVLCEEHNLQIQEMSKLFSDPECHEEIDINTYNKLITRWKTLDRKCPQHNMKIHNACGDCFKPLCNRCLDTPSEICSHRIVSVKQGAEGARDILSEKVNEIYAVDEKFDDLLKTAALRLDELRLSGERKKEKIRAAVDRIKHDADQRASELESLIDKSISVFETDIGAYNRWVKQGLDSNQEIVSRTAAFTDLQPVIALQHFKEQKKELDEMIDAQKATEPPQPPIAILKALEDPIPWKLTTIKPPYYHSIKMVDRTKLPRPCYAVCHLPDGRLVRGGNFGIDGLINDPSLEASIQGICVDTASTGEVYLYAVGYTKDDRLIYKINASNGNFDVVVKYALRTMHWCQHITTSKDYIIFTDKDDHAVKVYSKLDHVLKFNILLEDFMHPWGVEMLSNDTLLVSDQSNGVVRNISVSETPTTIWELRLQAAPSGVHYDQTTKCILVANDKETVNVISDQGQLLKELQLKSSDGPLSSFSDSSAQLIEPINVNDISVFDHELVLASKEGGILQYHIQCIKED